MGLLKTCLILALNKDLLSWQVKICCLVIAAFVLAGCLGKEKPLKKERPEQLPEEVVEVKPGVEKEHEEPSKEKVHLPEIDSDKDTLPDEYEISIGSNPRIANTWEGYERAYKDIGGIDISIPSLQKYESWLKDNKKRKVKSIVRIAQIGEPVLMLKPPNAQDGIEPARSGEGWLLVSDNYLYHEGVEQPEDIYFEIYYNFKTSAIRVYFYPFQKVPSTHGLVTIRVKNAKDNQLSPHRILPLLSKDPETSGKEMNIFFDQVQKKQWYELEFPLMYMFDKGDYLEVSFYDVEEIDGKESMKLNGKVAGYSEEITEEKQNTIEISGGLQITPAAIIPSVGVKYAHSSTMRHTTKTYDMELKAVGEARVSLLVTKLIMSSRILSHREINSFGYSNKLGLYYIEPVPINDKTRSYPSLSVLEKIERTEYVRLHANGVLRKGKILPAQSLKIRVLVNPSFEEWTIDELSVSLVGQPEDIFEQGYERTYRNIPAIELHTWKIDKERPIKYDLPDIISTRPITRDESGNIKGILLVNATFISKSKKFDGEDIFRISLPFANYLGRSPDKTARVHKEFNYKVRFQRCEPEITNGDYYIKFGNIKSSNGVLIAREDLEIDLDRRKGEYPCDLLVVTGASSQLDGDLIPELIIGEVAIKKDRFGPDKTIAKGKNLKIDLTHHRDNKKKKSIPIGNYSAVLQFEFSDTAYKYYE